MKLSDLTKGCEIQADASFTCLRHGPHKVDFDAGGPFIICDEGKHYMEGQEAADGELTGIAPVPQ